MWQKEKTVKNGQKIQDAHEAIRPTDITAHRQQSKEFSNQRSVPSVSADLETLSRQAVWHRHVMRQHL